MPSIASHYVVAKKVGRILNLENDDYLLGNILPDIIQDNNSHYKIEGTYYLIPNIKDFIKENKYNKNIFLGYLTHLLLDKYFLEEFIPNTIPNYKEIQLFEKNIMYNEYSGINYTLVKKYKLDVKHISDIINTTNLKINKEKVKKNITSLNNKSISKTSYLKLKKYTNFLNDISVVIAEDLKKVELI